MTELSTPERDALARAIDLAATSGVTRGPNPAVGAVVLDVDGQVVAEGWHRGPGQPHAEVEALAVAGQRAAGGTVVVSLEPCAHHGRTPPCTDALIAADVARVVFGQADPNPEAAGGAEVLHRAGLDVVGPAAAASARAVNAAWTLAQELQRPVVIWKVAASLDGRIAAADGTSKWITSALARAQTHELRASVDAVLTGTGTALIDRPQLTARPGGVPIAEQPLRAVMGLSALPDDHPLRDAVLLNTRDPGTALHLLWQLDVRRVMLECGPRLAGAFLTEGLIDRVVWFAAPMLLGSFGLAVADGGPTTLTDARRWQVTDLACVGEDVRIDLQRKDD